MRLTPKYLTTHQSEESLQADQALLFEPHSALEVGAHSLEAVTPLWPPLPGKAIKLFFSTSPTTLSLRFNSGHVHRD